MAKRKKQPLMMREEDHGLGINRDVPQAKVINLELEIFNAAIKAQRLGVAMEKFLELCECAYVTELIDENDLESLPPVTTLVN